MERAFAAVATGTPVVAHGVLGSTNAEALARARSGERGPLWITAREQRAGRGRRGRVWVSPPGNLYASLLLTHACGAGRAPELSFVGALALHDALAAIDPRLSDRLRLKWPNDVLLDGAKLAGILVEGETLPEGVFAAVLGFGVNCVSHPEETAYRACDLAEAGVVITPAEVLEPLSHAVENRLREWDRGKNFAAVRNAWLARAMGLGEPMRVRSEGGDLEGRFLTLDDAGRLVLGLPGGDTRAISTAEIFPITAGIRRQVQAGESV